MKLCFISVDIHPVEIVVTDSYRQITSFAYVCIGDAGEPGFGNDAALLRSMRARTYAVGDREHCHYGGIWKVPGWRSCAPVAHYDFTAPQKEMKD